MEDNVTVTIQSEEHEEDIKIENNKCVLVVTLTDDGARAGLFGTASGQDIVDMIYAIGLANPHLKHAFAAAVAIRLAESESQQFEAEDNIVQFPGGMKQ